jgi:hypothetical protein
MIFVCPIEMVHNAVICPLSNCWLGSTFQRHRSSFLYSWITWSLSSFQSPCFTLLRSNIRDVHGSMVWVTALEIDLNLERSHRGRRQKQSVKLSYLVKVSKSTATPLSSIHHTNSSFIQGARCPVRDLLVWDPTIIYVCGLSSSTLWEKEDEQEKVVLSRAWQDEAGAGRRSSDFRFALQKSPGSSPFSPGLNVKR